MRFNPGDDVMDMERIIAKQTTSLASIAIAFEDRLADIAPFGGTLVRDAAAPPWTILANLPSLEAFPAAKFIETSVPLCELLAAMLALGIAAMTAGIVALKGAITWAILLGSGKHKHLVALGASLFIHDARTICDGAISLCQLSRPILSAALATATHARTRWVIAEAGAAVWAKRRNRSDDAGHSKSLLTRADICVGGEGLVSVAGLFETVHEAVSIPGSL